MKSKISLSCILIYFHLFIGHKAKAYTDNCEDLQIPKKRIVCYYRIEEEFRPYNLDPCLCTHIIYSYVAVRENFAFIAGKKGDLKFLAGLKKQNPHIQILVSLRPSNNQFSLDEASNINTTSTLTKEKFALRVRDFITRHGLDGVDLDWQYFKEAEKQNSKRQTLISVLKILHNELQLSNLTGHEVAHYLLTITTSKLPKDLTDNYDFESIYKYVDFVNLPAFNFDTQGNTVMHPSRVHGISDMENMDSMIDLVLSLGLPQERVVVGVPAHGILYKLSNSSLTIPGSPAIPWNNEEALISHSKICTIRDDSNWTLVREKDLTAPYIYNRDKWIGFDDEISIKLKAKYVVMRQLGGIAVWSANDDDPTGKCGYGPFPLLQSVKRVLTKPVHNINYYSENNTYNSLASSVSQSEYPTENSFVAVIEKYGNVERLSEEESESSHLKCTVKGYIRHPQDCTKFYRCIKFNQKESTEIFQYSCPIGLVFDEKYEICNWPSWSPPCVGSGEIIPTPRKKFLCPSYGYFQDPDNCEYFYYCSDFGKGYLQAYEFKCPFELAFDEDKLLCNWKWLVRGCGAVSPDEPIVKQLPQIYDLNTEADIEASHKFLKRSDVSFAHQNSKLSADLSKSSPNIKSTFQREPFKTLKQHVTNFVGFIGQRVKSLLGDSTHIKSRADTSETGWLSHLNPFALKSQKTRQQSQGFGQRRGANKQDRNINKQYAHHSEQFISIPIIQIRPVTQQFDTFNNKKPEEQQFLRPSHATTGRPANEKLAHNRVHIPASKQPKAKTQTLASTRFGQMHDIIPVPVITVRNRNRQESQFPNSQKAINQEQRKSSTSKPKIALRGSPPTPNTPNVGYILNNFDVNSNPMQSFHFPTNQHISVEPIDEINLSHLILQQTFKTNANNYNQFNDGLGKNTAKERLQFSKDVLNVDHIKSETNSAHKKIEPQNRSKLNSNKITNNENYNKNSYVRNPSSFSNDHKIDSPPMNTNPFYFESLMQYPSQGSEFKPFYFDNIQFDGLTIGHDNSHSSPEKDRLNEHMVKEIQPENSNHFVQHSTESIESPKKQFNKQFSTQQQTGQQRQKQYPREQANKEQSQPQQYLSQKQIDSLLVQHLSTEQNSKHKGVQYLPTHQTEQNFAKQDTLKQPSAQPIHSQHSEHQTVRQHTIYATDSQKDIIQAEKPKPIVYWTNSHRLDKTRNTNNPQAVNLNANFNDERRKPNIAQIEKSKNFQSNRQTVHSSGKEKQVDLDEQLNANKYLPANGPPVETFMPHTYKNSDNLDVSATHNKYYANNYQVNRNHDNNKHRLSATPLKLRIISTTKRPIVRESSSGSKKSQLLIIPVADEHSNVQKYSNLERLTKEHPKLFPNGLSNTRVSTVKYETVRYDEPIRATTPTSPLLSSIVTPQANDDYVMVMFNNEEHLLSKKNGTKAHLQELFRKTDGKLYNLETDNSQTIVALVPKGNDKNYANKNRYQAISPTTQKPEEIIVYESAKSDEYSTKSPLIIKLEIPHEKSDMLQTIVQKVKEGLTPFSDQITSKQTIQDSHIIYKTQNIQTPTINNPGLTQIQQTIPPYNAYTTETPVQNSKQPNIANYHLKDAQSKQTTQSDNAFNSYTASPKQTQHDSAVLEHIPVYNAHNGYNIYNYSQPSWHMQMPWYHQMAYNPYYQPYPQIPNQTIYSQYQQYPIASNYAYQSPHTTHSAYNAYQPQFLPTNSTSFHWYDWYSSQPVTTEKYNNDNLQEDIKSHNSFSTADEMITTILTTLSSTTTTTTTTTPPPTTYYNTPKIDKSDDIYDDFKSSIPNISPLRNTKANTQSLHSSKLDKTSSHQNKQYDDTFDSMRTKGNRNEDTPQIQVYIVQGEEKPQLIQSQPDTTADTDKSDVKVIVIDGTKRVEPTAYQPLKETNSGYQYTGHENEKHETRLPKNKERNQNYQTVHNLNKYEYEVPVEMQYVESANNFKVQESYDNQYLDNSELKSLKDIEYEDDSQLQLPPVDNLDAQYHQYLPASKVQSLQSLYNSNAYPGLRNFTDSSVPETACTRPGLFQHPSDCNKYYECYWDKYINRFTLHSFECPVKLAFDSRIVGCSILNDPTICVQY